MFAFFKTLEVRTLSASFDRGTERDLSATSVTLGSGTLTFVTGQHLRLVQVRGRT